MPSGVRPYNSQGNASAETGTSCTPLRKDGGACGAKGDEAVGTLQLSSGGAAGAGRRSVPMLDAVRKKKEEKRRKKKYKAVKIKKNKKEKQQKNRKVHKDHKTMMD